jgi:uncharacterized protein DUF5681
LGMEIKKGLNEKVTVRNGDDGVSVKMTEREFAVASLVHHAMKGDMAAIKLVLKLDREAESVEREFEESQRKVPEWTDENEKLYQRYLELQRQRIEG